jgi:ribosomal protein S18 acetylase RimI-like enzyme
MEFEEASANDYKSILALYQQFNEDRIEAGVGDSNYQILGGETPWAATLKDKDCKTFVIKEKNTVLGFITLRKTQIAKLKSVHNLLEVDLIVVNKKIRRRGLGTLIFKKAKSEAKDMGATHIILNVLESNNPAMHFWSKMGFKKISKTEYERLDGTCENTLYMIRKI